MCSYVSAFLSQVTNSDGASLCVVCQLQQRRKIWHDTIRLVPKGALPCIEDFSEAAATSDVVWVCTVHARHAKTPDSCSCIKEGTRAGAPQPLEIEAEQQLTWNQSRTAVKSSIRDLVDCAERLGRALPCSPRARMAAESILTGRKGEAGVMKFEDRCACGQRDVLDDAAGLLVELAGGGISSNEVIIRLVTRDPVLRERVLEAVKSPLPAALMRLADESPPRSFRENQEELYVAKSVAKRAWDRLGSFRHNMGFQLMKYRDLVLDKEHGLNRVLDRMSVSTSGHGAVMKDVRAEVYSALHSILSSKTGTFNREFPGAKGVCTSRGAEVLLNADTEANFIIVIGVGGDSASTPRPFSAEKKVTFTTLSFAVYKINFRGEEVYRCEKSRSAF